MAYIAYGQATPGGAQLTETLAKLVKVADELRDLTAWVGAIGAENLETNTDFSVGAGDGQGFNDTLAQINADVVTFMEGNREKISRLARGS